MCRQKKSVKSKERIVEKNIFCFFIAKIRYFFVLAFLFSEIGLRKSVDKTTNSKKVLCLRLSLVSFNETFRCGECLKHHKTF